MANEPERLPCALHEVRATLTAPPDSAGFGLAHYVDDRLLLNLRPSSIGTGSSAEDLVGNLRTGTFVASLHAARDGGPYKFRSWAFALQGSTGREAARGALLQKLPDFLQRNIASDALAEAAFHRFLAFLHEDHKVDDPSMEMRLVALPLRRTMELLTHASPSSLGRTTMMVTNGRFMAATQVGGGLAYNLREGILACQRCQLDRALDPFPVRESHRRFRGVLLAGGLNSIPTGFLEVPEGRTVVINRKLDLQLL
jgi:hypothetical protein